METVNGFGPNDVILDIRSIDEQEDKPLKVEGIDVVSLPFYKLSTKFGDLDQNKTWLLWCERGVMSRLQALYLREQGFNNVKVARNLWFLRRIWSDATFAASDTTRNNYKSLPPSPVVMPLHGLFHAQPTGR